LAGKTLDPPCSIARRVKRWRFDFSADADRSAHEAVIAAVQMMPQQDWSATACAVLALRRVDTAP